MGIPSNIELKVCGMREDQNIRDLMALEPNYMGLIFWKPSSRYVSEPIPETLKSLKKVGVFVNESIEVILEKVSQYQLEGLQIHGKETPEYLKNLKESLAAHSYNGFVMKAFSVDESFDFNSLKAYEAYTDYFLFDTKGALPGGNGTPFSWELLDQYHLETPYFLSGGIGLEEVDQIKDFFKSSASQKCVALDVNSRFEIEPALKDIEQLKAFKTRLYHES